MKQKAVGRVAPFNLLVFYPVRGFAGSPVAAVSVACVSGGLCGLVPFHFSSVRPRYFGNFFFAPKMKNPRDRGALRVRTLRVTTQQFMLLAKVGFTTNRKSGLDFLKYFHLLLDFGKIAKKSFRIGQKLSTKKHGITKV